MQCFRICIVVADEEMYTDRQHMVRHQQKVLTWKTAAAQDWQEQHLTACLPAWPRECCCVSSLRHPMITGRRYPRK